MIHNCVDIADDEQRRIQLLSSSFSVLASSEEEKGLSLQDENEFFWSIAMFLSESTVESWLN